MGPVIERAIEALEKVQQRLAIKKWYVGEWIDKLERADEIVFTFDRPAWDAAYANASSDVPLQMQGRLFYEEPGEDDPPSPRWLALNEPMGAEACGRRGR